MPKLTPVTVEGGDQVRAYYYDCPGCKAGHEVAIKPYALENGATWYFSGTLDSPTLTPSVMAQWTPSSASGKPPIVCHHFVKDGKIQFLSDCTHSLKGQTVEMLEV